MLEVIYLLIESLLYIPLYEIGQQRAYKTVSVLQTSYLKRAMIERIVASLVTTGSAREETLWKEDAIKMWLNENSSYILFSLRICHAFGTVVTLACPHFLYQPKC